MKKSTLEKRSPSVNKVKKKVSIIVITFCANFVSLLSHNCNASLSGHCATTDSTDLMGNFFFFVNYATFWPGFPVGALEKILFYEIENYQQEL